MGATGADRERVGTAGADIAVVDRSAPLRTSSHQRRIWFADQFDATGLQYIYAYDVRLRGALDVSALDRALDLMVVRHETLRTRIVAVDGEPWQVPGEPYRVGLIPQPIAGESGLRPAVEQFVNRRFDLAEGVFLRAALFQLAPDDHALVLQIHHIATDGWSNGIVLNEIATAYNAFVAGKEPDLPPLSIQYGDYAVWQREWLADGGAKGDLAYWRKQLADAPTMLALPVDRPWPQAQSFRGDSLMVTVPQEPTSKAEQLGVAEHATLFMVLLAAFHLTLARWTGQSDLVIGTGAANRAVPGTERLVGPFINMLPLRARVDEAEGFRALLRQVRDTAFEAYDHVGAPFDRIVEELSPERSLSRNAVIQTTLTEATDGPLALDGLEVDRLEGRLKTVRFDLTFYYAKQPDGTLQIEVNYATDILERDTVEALGARFVATLEELLADPDRPMCLTAAATPAELDLLRRWGTGEPAEPQATTVHQEMARCAAEHPDRVAVVAGSRSSTFAELDAQAGRIATLLEDLGAEEESPVGILMGRSGALPAAILGVLKAGAYYVPLDPAYPAERLTAMIRDSGVRIVLTDDSADVGTGADGRAQADGAADRLPGVRFTPVSDADRYAPAAAKPVDGDGLAYAIYTSGSTGDPKPVLVTHASVMNLLRGLEQAGVAGPGHGRVGWNASCSFDASVQQWIRLARGDTLVLITEPERADPLVLAKLIDAQALTHLDITPTHLTLLIDHLPERCAAAEPLYLLIGGEAIPPALWERIDGLRARGSVAAVNLYGPTEATVDTTAAWISGTVPNIGRPLRARRVAVVDAWLRPVPPGVSGEIVIGGTGLARGYGGRPGLTAQCFIADPFSSGSRLYRTGDRARWRRDGSLEYLGRDDRQVKLRGFRIELDEVGAVLSIAPGVGMVVAAVRELSGGPGLVAYCTAAGEGTLDPASVRAYAARRLPTFMVPELVIAVEVMPVGPGGKVDEAALPDPDAFGVDADEGLIGPIEKLVAQIWCQLLQVEEVGPADNFFSLGGHSMQATRMIATIRKRINLALPITVAFKYPRLRALSQHIEAVIRERMAADATSE